MDNKEIDVTAMPIEEAMKNIKVAMSHRYPGCGMMYFTYSNHGENRVSSFGCFGDKTELNCAGTDIALRDKNAHDFVHDVFCNNMISLPSSMMDTPARKVLHDAIVDYAKERGIDVTGIPYYARKEQKKDVLTDPDKGKMRDVEAIAARIKMLEDEIKCLKRSIDPLGMAAVLKAEAKQLRRAGDIIGAKAKDQEAEKIQDKVKRTAEAKRKAVENLKKARAAKAKKKQQREQAEKDRKKAQQFNPHAAAKAKMKKIRERQAERAAGKKKGSETKEWVNRPISQVIAARVG